MKLLVVLALVAASATAHWTHDESLAREIGPPPGEEDDVDVHALSDSLLSEEEKAKSGQDDDKPPEKRYRITIGTKYYDNIPAGHSTPPMGQWYNGASNSNFEVYLKGDNLKFKDQGPIDSTINGGWSTIQYYVGPAMTYKMAEKVAPQLHPGMIPLMTDDEHKCYGRKPKPQGVLKNCAQDNPLATVKMNRCEPNTKMCMTMLDGRHGGPYDVGKVGYAPARPVKVASGDPDADPDMNFGLIQRGQIYGKDVGEINEVQIREMDNVKAFANDDKACAAHNEGWMCSSPWWPSFAKINSNDPKTGIGNGIYYVHPKDGMFIGSLEINIGEQPYATETGKLRALPEPVDVDAKGVSGTPHNAQIKKCIAQVCEEEMDAMFGMSMLDTEEFLG